MSNIFARSPFIVHETGSVGDLIRVDLYIWNGTGAVPGSPVRTLSKTIPSASVLYCDFNISPFIREYFTLTYPNASCNYNTNGLSDSNHWCNVTVKTYINGTIHATSTYKAFDGYTEYQQGYNYDHGDIHLNEGTYYYYYDPNGTLSSDDSIRVGQLQVQAGAAAYTKIKYTNLDTSATVTTNLGTSSLRTMPRIHYTYYGANVKTEILDDANVVLKTFYFRPIEECKYNVITVDFLNKYGAWDRTFFFKASRNTFEVSGTDYNLMHQQVVDYDYYLGTKRIRNINTKESIICNTGWVDEVYINQLKQLMNSEYIYIQSSAEFGSNYIPVKLRTKQLNVQKHINDKLINYQIEFEYAFDGINTVQ